MHGNLYASSAQLHVVLALRLRCPSRCLTASSVMALYRHVPLNSVPPPNAGLQTACPMTDCAPPPASLDFRRAGCLTIWGCPSHRSIPGAGRRTRGRSGQAKRGPAGAGPEGSGSQPAWQRACTGSCRRELHIQQMSRLGCWQAPCCTAVASSAPADASSQHEAPRAARYQHLSSA